MVNGKDYLFKGNISKSDFNDLYDKAKDKNFDYMAVSIRNKNVKQKSPEIIINTKSNFSDKVKYYNSAYNKDMELNHNNYIQMNSVTFFSDFSVMADLFKALRELESEEEVNGDNENE